MQSSFCGRFEKHLTKSYILIYSHEYNSDVVLRSIIERGDIDSYNL